MLICAMMVVSARDLSEQMDLKLCAAELQAMRST